MYRNRHGDEESNGREVAERQDLVTRNHNRDQNAERDKDQAGRHDRGMAKQQRWIEANQEILAAKFRLQTFTRLFGNRVQAIHDRFDDARHQQHYGRGFHRQLEDTLQVVARQRADDQTHYKTDGDRFAKRTEAFLDVVSAEVDAVQAGNFFDNRIDQHRYRP